MLMPVLDEEAFKSSHIEVIGISPDPVAKQKEFAEKQKITVRTAPGTVAFWN